MAAVGMEISAFGLSVIEAFEGFFPKPYYCPAGVLTQGYGHTAAAGGKKIGGIWSRSDARRVLRDDLSRKYEPGVRALLKREPTQAQYDSMVSFAFNCGVQGFAGSSVLKFFNRGKDAQAAAAFALWVKGGGKTLPGLVRRRGSEALMYQGIQDTNYDGRRQSAEPIYGVMPQAVEPAREKPMQSSTMQGIVVASSGQALQRSAQPAGETLKSVADALAPATIVPGVETVIGYLAVAGVVLTVGGLVYAGYHKWRDMGSPIPFFRVFV